MTSGFASIFQWEIFHKEILADLDTLIVCVLIVCVLIVCILNRV